MVHAEIPNQTDDASATVRPALVDEIREGLGDWTSQSAHRKRAPRAKSQTRNFIQLCPGLIIPFLPKYDKLRGSERLVTIK